MRDNASLESPLMPPSDLQELDHPAISRSPVEPAPLQKSRWLGPVLGAGLLVALGVAIFAGIRSRAANEQELARTTNEAAVPTVEVIHPKAGAPDVKLVLPGNAQPFSDTAIYARTSGYLKRWYVDIGAHVKRGEPMAEIDTPEVDDQLRQARADLSNAEATLELAVVTAQRKQKLVQTNVASLADRDSAVSGLNAARAQVQSRQAAVARLEKLQSFERVEAPFDGIVTARTIDVGALIAAGSATADRELFHLVAINWLRIYVSIPETYSPAMHAGLVANVTLDEFPGETFKGVLVRTSNSIDQTSHTLLVEVDVPNADERLLPGSYVHVQFMIPTAGRAVVVPANALLFRKEGPQVAVVRDNKVELVAAKIGHDYGEAVEIVSGLQPSDQIVANPADSLTSGTMVAVKTTDAVASAK
jgi:RND family efflux transporter MFP subunit